MGTRPIPLTQVQRDEIADVEARRELDYARRLGRWWRSLSSPLTRAAMREVARRMSRR